MNSKGTSVRRVLVGLAIASLIAGSAFAGVVTWNVEDHPNGALAGGGVSPYFLRLGTAASAPNTFTLGTSGASATFSFDPGTSNNLATLTGTMQHNRDSSGVISGGFYDVVATFSTVSFTNGGATVWYGANPTNAVFDDMLQDLLDNSDATTNNDTSFRSDLDRIYFALFDLDITYSGVGSDTYVGPLVWDEYPNAPDDKKFFIQKNHRTSSDVLAATGWLEEFEDGGRDRTSDFLFTLSQRSSQQKPPRLPEPATVTIVGLGLAALALARRRHKK